MSPRDRTAEFHSALSSIRARTAAASTPARSTPKPGQQNPSEFGRMAGQVAKDITQTTHKLQKLAQCEFNHLPEQGS